MASHAPPGFLGASAAFFGTLGALEDLTPVFFAVLGVFVAGFFGRLRAGMGYRARLRLVYSLSSVTSRTRTGFSQSGTAIGVVNAFVTGTGAVYQPMIGWLLDKSWSGTLVDGARIYSVGDYRIAFSVLVAGMVLGLGCAVAMRETRCRSTIAA